MGRHPTAKLRPPHSRAMLLDMLADMDLLGEALFVVWISCHELGRRAAKPVFGSQDVGGAPRWRSMVGMGTSLGALPMCLVAAVLHAGGFAQWLEVSGQLRPYDRAFCYIFGGLMTIDFLQQTMHTTMLKVHHATCLAGHLWTTFLSPAGFASYFSGVVALEVGSAGTCAHALWPHRFTPALLLGVMTLSNLAAAAVSWPPLKPHSSAARALELIGHTAPAAGGVGLPVPGGGRGADGPFRGRLDQLGAHRRATDGRDDDVAREPGC